MIDIHCTQVFLLLLKCRRLAFPDFQSGCNVDLQLSPRNLVKLKSEELGIDDDRVAERERGG